MYIYKKNTSFYFNKYIYIERKKNFFCVCEILFFFFFLGRHQPHRPHISEEENNSTRVGRLYGAHLAKILLGLHIRYSEYQQVKK